MKFQANNTKSRKAEITIDQFQAGSVDLVDEARMKPNMAKESTNLMQVSDG